MSSDKCEHFDRGFCKYKDLCPKVHPNINCDGNCEDKRVCTKRHKISCQNGSSCKWKSCEFLHVTNNQENEQTEVKVLDRLVEERIEAFAARVNKYMDSLLQLFLKEKESVNKRIDAI